MPGEGGETKTRTVETRFTVKDLFSGEFGKIQAKASEGAKKIAELQTKFRDFRREQGFTTLGALGLGYGIGSWIEKTREANSEFGRMQKGIAGVLAGSLKFEKGASEVDRYRRSMELSKDVMEDHERVAGRFQVGLDDIDQTYRTLVAGAGTLGITQKQINALTEDAIATQKRFGGAGDEAARLILRGLQTGRIRAVDPFSASLSNAIGNMSKLTRAQRFEHIQRALQGSRQIADAMSTGIDASLNRARITVDGLLRDATGPLFSEIAASLDKWAKHLREARENGKPLIDEISSKLVSGLHAVERVSGFIKEHWLAIAGVNLGTKLLGNAEKIAGMFGGIGGAAGEGAGGGVIGGLGAMASKLGMVVGGLSAFEVALQAVIGAVESHVDAERAKDEKAQMGMGSLGVLAKVAQKQRETGMSDAKTELFGRRAVDELKKYGIVSNGKLDRGALTDAITRMEAGQKEALATTLGIRNKFLPVSQMAASQFVEPLVAQLSGVVDQYAKAAAVLTKKATDDKALPFQKGNTIINGNINVQMKFEEEDPDRVFVRFTDRLGKAITRRGQAITAEPAGL